MHYRKIPDTLTRLCCLAVHVYGFRITLHCTLLVSFFRLYLRYVRFDCNQHTAHYLVSVFHVSYIGSGHAA